MYYCFILIISIDVYCHMFITTRVTRELKSLVMGTILRILYTLMFTAIAGLGTQGN